MEDRILGLKDAQKVIQLFENDEWYLHYGFCKYDFIYPYSTENIWNVLGTYQEQDKILTVLSSSDHVFSYLLKGARNISTFDINQLTIYYYELKKAMILTCRYLEFQEQKYNYEPLKVLEKLEELRTYLSDSAYSFWNYYKEHCFEKRDRILRYVSANQYSKSLYSKENYERLQSILKEGYQFDFTCSDIHSLVEKNDGPYQEIHISNIFDYVLCRKENYQAIIDALSSLLTEDGKIRCISYSNSASSKVLSQLDLTKYNLKKYGVDQYAYTYFKKKVF